VLEGSTVEKEGSHDCAAGVANWSRCGEAPDFKFLVDDVRTSGSYRLETIHESSLGGERAIGERFQLSFGEIVAQSLSVQIGREGCDPTRSRERAAAYLPQRGETANAMPANAIQVNDIYAVERYESSALS
jgi:hypothetical protein